MFLLLNLSHTLLAAWARNALLQYSQAKSGAQARVCAGVDSPYLSLPEQGAALIKTKCTQAQATRF